NSACSGTRGTGPGCRGRFSSSSSSVRPPPARFWFSEGLGTRPGGGLAGGGVVVCEGRSPTVVLGCCEGVSLQFPCRLKSWSAVPVFPNLSLGSVLLRCGRTSCFHGPTRAG